jgi:hypothetical protein
MEHYKSYLIYFSSFFKICNWVLVSGTHINFFFFSPPHHHTHTTNIIHHIPRVLQYGYFDILGNVIRISFFLFIILLPFISSVVFYYIYYYTEIATADCRLTAVTGCYAE